MSPKTGLSSPSVLLAMDFGEKKTGLALYHQERDPYPLPLTTLFHNKVKLHDEIYKIVQDEMVTDLIMGLPHYTDGSESQFTKKVKTVAADLIKFLQDKGLEVNLHFQDETYSSQEAQERMRQSPRYNFKVNPDKIDEIAAQIILEEFIQAERS